MFLMLFPFYVTFLGEEEVCYLLTGIREDNSSEPIRKSDFQRVFYPNSAFFQYLKIPVVLLTFLLRGMISAI